MTVQQGFVDLRTAMNQNNFERQDEVDLILTAILARQHVALIGPPGTGKSQLANDVVRAFNGNLFTYLFGKYTVPEELFGPYKMSLIKQDIFERNTERKLPEADIAFCDEIFKASSSILNALLTIMNEREFDNNGRKPVPLRTLVGASNELPESDELAAMFDRFHLRKKVDYLYEPSNFVSMLKHEPVPMPTLDIGDVDEAHQLVQDVQFDPHLYEVMYDIRSALSNAGIVASDRRFRQAVTTLKAFAFLQGRDHVVEDDFTVLQHMLWTDPKDTRAVARVILAHTNEINMEAEDLLDAVLEIAGEVERSLAKAKADGVPATEMATQGVEWFRKCRSIKKNLETLHAKAIQQGRSEIRVVQVMDRCEALAKNISSGILQVPE